MPPEDPAIVFSEVPAPYRIITAVPEYWFDDLRPGDRVLDIGANAGAFCIRAARRGGIVTAVEPVTTDLLAGNCRLNGVEVTVIRGALGTGMSVETDWDGCRAVTPGYPLRTLIAMAGGCDFLKCDCEGAEWLICPADLAPVRRIEMELHLPPIGGPVNPALLDYIGRRYNFSIERKPCHDILGVMGVLHAVRK